ncbi:MAG TPA: PF20097 family protein [Thermoplasmata archaeon]|nr:PF20097 family protein [Thermoplasmata archaeon]
MSGATCKTCGGPLEAGFVSSTNGSGLFWSHETANARLRPKGLEVLVPTGFGGTFSANLPGLRCAACRTILLQLPK